MSETNSLSSGLKLLALADVLMRNFVNGYSPTELAGETGYSKSDVTRYVATLIEAGWAERIADTGRIRPSVSLARKAVQILNAVGEMERRTAELKQRLNTGV